MVLNGIGCFYGSHKFLDFSGVFEAFVALKLDPRADINGQRQGFRPKLANAIGHICRRQSTTQNEVSVDVWRKL